MKSIVFLLATFLSVSAFSQNQDATFYINQLKNGALLVRLKTQNNQIEALAKKRGTEKQIADLKLEVANEQERWMAAYKIHYTFSKVYFFYDYHYNQIIDNKHPELVFDADLKPLSKMDFNYLVVGQDLSSNMSLSGIQVLNAQMETLPKGFPDFIKKYGGLLNTKVKTEAEMVIELNERLMKRAAKE